MVSLKYLAAILRFARPSSIFLWNTVASFFSIAACLLSEHHITTQTLKQTTYLTLNRYSWLYKWFNYFRKIFFTQIIFLYNVHLSTFTVNGKRWFPLSTMLHLQLQVLAGFPLLLQPCRCFLGLQDLEDPLLLLHLLPEWGEPAKLHLYVIQLQSEKKDRLSKMDQNRTRLMVCKGQPPNVSPQMVQTLKQQQQVRF